MMKTLPAYMCAATGVALLASGAIAQTAVDVYCDFETGSHGDVITTTVLSNATHTAFGNWSILGTGMTISTNYETTLNGSVTVQGTNYNDSGSTRTFRCPADIQSTFVEFTPAATTTDASVGCFFRYGGAASTTWMTYDILYIHRRTGKWAVLGLKDWPTPVMYAHTEDPAVRGPYISIEKDTTYWLSLVDGPTNAEVRVYNAATFEVIGTSSLPHTTPQDIMFFRFGRTDGHGNSQTNVFYFDDVVLDLDGSLDPAFIPDDTPTPPHPYWVSTTGTDSWANAQSSNALAGAACTSISTMNANAAAGDTVYIRAGTTAAGTGQIALVNDGSSGNVIDVSVYSNETFIISDRTNIQGPAIELSGSNHITLRGITTSNCQESVDLNACTNIIIEDCTFTNHRNDESGWPVAVSLVNNSQSNIVRRTVVGSCGYEAAGDDKGSCVNLGTQDSEVDATRYNLFADCTLYRGGHDVVSDYASYNFFDRCFFYSDEWYGSGQYGSRAFITQDDGSATVPEHGNNTFRDCTFHRSGDPPDSDGVAIISLRTRRTRVVRCVFVDGANAGVNMSGPNAVENRIAHCTFVRNGIDTPMSDAGQKGGVTFLDSSGDPASNIVKNCIFRDNFADVSYEAVADPQTITNNWLHATGNPLFVSWDTNDLSPETLLTHDLGLQAKSAAIDAGAWITTAAATTSGTALVVADAFWFTDGGGITDGDEILIQGISTNLSVTAVDYSTHTLTITPAASWTSGDGVSFSYAGSAPDYGANEGGVFFWPEIADAPPNRLWMGVP